MPILRIMDKIMISFESSGSEFERIGGGGDMERIARIIRLKPEAIDEYKKIHAEVWPGVLATIATCHIRNYSIFLREPENLLFAYFEYHGTDFEADMAKMAEDETTRRWWKITDPMQASLESAADGEWWAPAELVFHQP